MLEKEVEAYLVRQCYARGWLCYKFSSPSNRAVPDRVLVLPGRVVFVECKAPGKRPTKQQEWMHGELSKRGALVRVVDGHKPVRELMLELEADNAI
jgi:hypothetical protein